MLKRIGLIGVTAAAATFLVVACGENLGTGNGGCSSDSDCQSNEVCHPDAKVCLTTCSSSADCPDSAKTCAAIGNGNSAQICKCSTDPLCDQGKSGQICSTAFNICINKCGGNSDCPSGFTCDTGNGQCTAGASGCNPACTGNQVCDTGSNTCVDKCTFDGCASGQNCNLQTGVCESAATCSTSAQQPASCSNGQFCSGGTCDFVPKVDPTACQNFQGKDALNWNPGTDTGPVIFFVEKTDDTSWPCADPSTSALQAQVKAYRQDGQFASTVTGNQGFFYVKVNGDEIDATTLVRPSSGYTRSSDGKEAEFKVNFCFTTSQNQIQIGLFFTNGNPACATLTR